MSASPFDEFQRAPDPFDEFQRATPPVGAVLKTAVQTNPDDMAEAVRLAKRYPAPVDSLYRNLPKVRFAAVADDAADQLATAKALSQYLASRPHVAGMAHDDIPKLKEIESNFAQTAPAAAAQAVLGISEGIWRTPDAAQRAVGYLASTVEKTGLPPYLNPIRGVQDVLQFISEGRLPVGPKLMAGTTDVADRISGAQEILTDRATFGNAFADVQTLAKNADQALATAVQTGNLEQVGQVLTDPNYWSAFMAQAVPSLYLAMKSGGSVAFMGWLEGMEQASNAAEFEKRTGIKVTDQEFTQAFAQTAIVNALLERYGLDKVLGAKGNGLKGLAKAMAAEGGTEGLQQINSNLAALLAYNQEQGLTEGVLASVMGGVASGGGVSAAQQGAQQVQALMERQQQQARAAAEDAGRLQQLLGAAGQSLLRERSPEDFRAYVQTLGDKPLYVDGEVLNQLPAEVLNQLPESVREQIADAAATGDTVEIPMADVLTIAPGTPLEQVLNEHARMDPFASSKAEVAAAQDVLKQEAERVIQQAADAQVAQQEFDTVKAMYAEQIAATGRYRPAVAEQMGTWIASFYTAYGSRVGMTPTQFQQRYPVRVAGVPSSAGQVIDQGQALTPEMKAWFDEPGPENTMVNEDGTPRVLYHGTTKANVKGMKALGEIRRSETGAMGPGIYLGDDRSVSEAYMPGKGGAMLEVYARGKYLDNAQWTEYIQAHGWKGAEAAAKADGWAGVHDQKFENAVVVWDAANIKVVENARPRESRDIFNQPGSAKFDAWFGDSKVVDAEGKPLVVYRSNAVDSVLSGKTQRPESGMDGLRGNAELVSNLLQSPTFRLEGLGGFDAPTQRVVLAAVRGFGLDPKVLGSVVELVPVDVVNVLAGQNLSPESLFGDEAVLKNLLSVNSDRPVTAAVDVADALVSAVTGMTAKAPGVSGDGVGSLLDGGSASGTGEVNVFLSTHGGKLQAVDATMVQQKSNDTGNNGNFDPQNPSILEQRATRPLFDQAREENFRRWSNDAPLVTSADATTRQFKTGEKVVVEAFHGTKRPDRVGTKFLKKRATSGPMAYHTSDPTLASSYATGKQDTSLSMEDQGYSNWFKVKLPGERSATDFVRSWYRLDAATKDKIAALAPRVTFSEEQEADGGNKIVLGDESVTSGTGSYDYNLAATRTTWDRRGNPLKALVEDWLNSGNLFNDEQRFMQVLKLAGFPMQSVEYDSPHSEFPFVYKNYIAMQKPLVTSDVPQDVKDALNAAAKKDRSRAQAGGADAWDKNTRTLKEWVAAFNSEDNTYVWTSIPDKVTEVFKSLGYDGIIDWSGKGGGPAALVAPVYIPFEETQVKSALGNKGTFSDTKNDILAQQAQTPRGTFNPATLELVLNPNANLSTWFHETGHFFLEVMADVASQPGAPAQIVEDFNTFLKWAGITGDEDVGGADSGVPLGQQAEDADAVYQEIAADQEMIDALEVYMVSGDPPEGALNDKLVAYLRRLPPVPADSYLTFYRNQPRGVRAWGRGWASWTTNEDQTRFFGGRDFEVLKRKGAQGINLERLGEARGRITGDYHQYGSQAEWLLLNESVGLNQDGQPAPATQPLPKRRTPLETWNAMTLDQKRPYHERWAESIEQYVMEGKAPSVELQPLMRRFSAWLKSVYGSIKQFLAARGVPAAGGGETLGQSADNPPAWWAEPSENRYAPEGATNGDLILDWLTRHNVAQEDGKYVFYHATPKKGGATDTLRDGSYLETDSEAAKHFAGRDRGLKPSQIKVAKVLLHPWQIWPGVFAQVRGGDVTGVVFKQDPAAQPGPALQLNDDIRRVMDRMLATDEQIQQANEVAGLVPDEAADGVAEERLRKRSIADLKWAVKARDAVIAKLKKEARAIEKAIRERVTEEVDAMPEMRAKAALDALQVDTEYDGVLKAWKDQRAAAETAAREEVKAALLADNPDAQGLAKGQLLAKNKRDLDNKVDAAMIKWDAANPRPSKARYANDQDLATVADSFGYESVDAMLQAVDAFDRRDLIDGMTEQRMLEEHGDLVDERAMQAAANEAVHNEARARSLATELRTQAEMLNPRTDTGETTATGRRVTVNALVEAAKQFAANVVGKTSLRDLKAKAWQHTAAERRASKRWQEATAAGKTQDAVKAKQDQMLNHAAAKAAIDAQAEARKILDFFARVTKGNDETVVEKGRDADLVNAARAVLAAYGVQTPASKGAEAYLESLAKHDPETYNVVKPMADAATQNAQPLEALTFDELQALHEEVQAMWFLAKRTRQMEVDGDLLDIDDVAQELYSRMEEIGIPDEVPGERGALTRGELLARQWLQQAPALLRRVEQWAEAKDGKFGGPFLRFIFQPVKDAADRYRTARLEYRKKFQSLVDNIAPMMTPGTIDAPELGYVFGRGHNGGGMAELLHAIAHTGNESNKRKLLLGRQWATELPDGTLDTGRWDAFIQRLANEGRLQREHFDFVQGVWDLLEETKPLAQKTHREVFGRYFAEVTADAFVDPFGVQRRGGYIPAQADPLLVQDADLRELLETDNVAMSQAFPQTNRGFTKSRVEYNRPLKLDLRTLPQHIDKVLLFAHMEPAVRGVARVLRRPKVSQPLARIDPAAMGAMLKPWLNRSARQTVETPISADAGLNRMASAVRGRVGMALMFANVSNTLQQITGSLTASIKVKPGLMMRATAQFIANPKKFKQSVWDISPYMADRAANEVAVLSDTLDKILVNPSVWQSAEHFTRRHAYFLQTAFDNQMSPIIWTASYNQALADGVDERMAVRFADGVIRQTQGSTLPEDVSRIETGPAYARLFTQFVGYFNMMANTNATAIQQIAAEQGLRKGAGKAFYTLLLGLLAPIWVAEAIAHAMRGGPDDEDDDGWLDDWLVAVFGFGTIRGLLSGVPFLGAVGQSVVNRFNRQPADDKFSLSPTVSVLESAAGAPASVYKAIVEDKSKQRAVRDTAALITVLTGLPAMAVARPLGYAAGVADDRIDPTSGGDLARGLVTGTASPESRTP